MYAHAPSSGHGEVKQAFDARERARSLQNAVPSPSSPSPALRRISETLDKEVEQAREIERRFCAAMDYVTGPVPADKSPQELCGEAGCVVESIEMRIGWLHETLDKIAMHLHRLERIVG